MMGKTGKIIAKHDRSGRSPVYGTAKKYNYGRGAT